MSYAKKLFALPLVGLALLMGLAGPANAQLNITEGLTQVGESAEIDTDTDLQDTIGAIINVILGFLGIIFLVLVIYAGFLWMTAGGNADKVDKAKSILVQSVIGLVILLAAYAISTFVIESLAGATGVGA